MEHTLGTCEHCGAWDYLCRGVLGDFICEACLDIESES